MTSTATSADANDSKFPPRVTSEKTQTAASSRDLSDISPSSMTQVSIEDGGCDPTSEDAEEEDKISVHSPAKDVMEEMNRSWRRLNDFARPIVGSMGRRADRLLRRMNVFDKWRQKRATPIPIVAVIVVVYYVIQVSVGLVIRDYATAIAWEELFVISTFAFEWVCTTTALRTFVASELTAARTRRDAEDEAINRLAALAQSDPMTVVVVLGVLFRMAFRVAAFSIRALFVGETAIELVFVFVFSLYMVLVVASTRRRRAKSECDVASKT